MKKLTSIIIVILLIKGMTLFASPVDTSDVKTVALNFFRSNSNVEGLNQTTQTTVNIVYVHPFTREMNASQSNALYVCNIGQNGFVVVSSDNRVEPVLGYSLSEPFTPNNMPPAMLWLFDDYAWQIASLYHLDTILPVHSQWEELMAGVQSLQSTGGNVVGPLLTTKWNQGGDYYTGMLLYNYFTPYQCGEIPQNMWNGIADVDTLVGDHAPAGCVPVALAQIDHYHYQDQNQVGQGTHTNTCPLPSYLCTDYSMTADFGSTVYHHPLMPNILTSSSTPTQIFEVSRLIIHTGIAVNACYDMDGTSASNMAVVNAMLNYFGFSHAQLFTKSNYLSGTWVNMLKAQIDSLHPVYYSGAPPTGASGHAFVVDGYKNNNYFHINWGWGGSFDDYFILGDLTPGNHNYNSYQQAIFSATPQPAVSVSPKKMNFKSYNDRPSLIKTVTVNNANLTHNVTVSVSSPFQISDSFVGSSFGSSISITPGPKTLYVRYAPEHSTYSEHHEGLLTVSYDTMHRYVELKGNHVVRNKSPKHLELTHIYADTILLSWEPPEGLSSHTDTLSYENHWATTYRYNGDYTISMIQRYCDTDLLSVDPAYLTAICFIPQAGVTEYRAVAYKGGEVEGDMITPGVKVLDQSIDTASLIKNTWNTIQLNVPVEVDIEQELWIGIYAVVPQDVYAMPVGDTNNYVPFKGNLIEYYNNDGSSSWHWLYVNRNFCLKGVFETIPPELDHYSVYRNNLLLGTTLDTNYVDVISEDGLYEYRVTAFYVDTAETSITDSIYVEIPNQFQAIEDSICKNGTYAFFGEELTHPGTFIHNANRLYTLLHLHEKPISEVFDTLHFCASDFPYFWNNQSIIAQGEYSDTSIAQNGCDSVTHLQVYLVPAQLQVDKGALAFVAYDTSASKVKMINVQTNGQGNGAIAVVNLPFEISADSVQFSNMVNLNPGDQILYVRYHSQQNEVNHSDSGLLEISYDTVQVKVPLKGHHISTVYPAPENLQYSMIFPDTVHLTWQTPASLLQTSKTLSLDSLWSGHAYGWDNQNYKVSFLHRYSEEDLLEVSPSQLTGVSFIPKEDATAYRVVAYKGGSYKDSVLTPGVLVVSQDVNMSSLTYNTWNTVNLDVPVPIEADEELWVGVYVEAPSGTYTITVGEIANYIPEKGDVECFHAANGHDYWLFFGVNRNFTLKAEFQVQPPVLQHYDVYQNDSLLASVGIDSDYKCKQQVNECDYRVTAVYEGQKSASDSIHFLLIPEIVIDTTVLEQVVLISQNNNPSEPVVVDVFGVGTSHPLSMSVNGPFEVGYDTISFSHLLAFPKDSSRLFIRYAPIPTAKSYCEYGSLSIGYDTLSMEIPLKGYRITRNYQPPVNLQYVHILPDTVELTWQDPPLSIIEHVAYDTNWVSSYMYVGGDYTVAMLNRYCDTDLVHFYPGKLSHMAFVAPTGITQCRLVAYQGGHVKDGVLVPGTQILDQAVNLASLNMDQWNAAALNEPIPIDLSQELWIGVYIKAANGYYTMAVGDSTTYVPEKGNIEVFYTSDGNEYWRFFNHDVNFLISGVFQSDSLELSHYRVQRGEAVLCTTDVTNYEDVVPGPGTYLYGVTAVYSDGGEGQATINPYINAPLYYDTLNVEICSNENYNFFNTALNQQGVYYHFENQTWTVLNLQVKEAPDVAISASALYVPNPQPVTLTASGANTYLWSTGATSATISVFPENTTTYSVTGTSSLTNCTNTASVTIEVDHVGLNDVSLANISVFPNPANNLITVKGVQCDKFILCDMTGSAVFEKEVDLGEENTLSVSDVASGVYLLKVVKEDSVQCVFKVMISR